MGLVFFAAKGFSDFQIFTPKMSEKKTLRFGGKKSPTGYDESGQESGEESERGGRKPSERRR